MLVAMAGTMLVAPPAFGAHEAGAGDQSTTHLENPAFNSGNDVGGCPNGEFEYKIEPVSSGTYTDGATGTRFELTVYSTNKGQAFDFNILGGSAAEVRVKGGPNFNDFDYFVKEDHDGNDLADGSTVASDTRLHAPEQSKNKWYGLSHITFCYDTGTALEIVKTAVASSITIGDTFAYDITVSDVADGIDAINVTVTDTLVPDGLDWSIVSQDGTACSISDADTDGNVDDLSCTFAALADGASYTLRVATTTVATADDCDDTFTNIASASADNADTVTDDATIAVQCGGLQVVKTAKHKDTASSANLEATFTITDSNGDTHTVTTDATSGLACVDGLPLGQASVVEQSGPSGYALDEDTETVTVTSADCGSASVVTASFENVPLTDISWSVDSLHDGATLTIVTCYDGDGNVLAGYPVSVSDGSGTLPNLLPTDPDVTVSCEFVVDP